MQMLIGHGQVPTIMPEASIIYDNMNPNGMNYNEWLEDLGVFETPPGILKIDLDPF